MSADGDDPTGYTRISGVETAIRFVAAQPDGAGRILSVHYRRTNGLCAGCTATPISWPCPVGRIATDALGYDRQRSCGQAEQH
jgi:hypothetical protein